MAASSSSSGSIPKGHADILKSGATLQELADDAFALLLAKQRGKSR
jgi:hypothetical protein